MNTSLLEQELAPLNAQIEQVREKLAELECEMAAVEAELETSSDDRLRFDLLRDTCNVLDRLGELQAGQLFWGEVPEFKDPAGHMARLRSHIARFDGEIRGVLEKQADLKARANRCLDELDSLHDEVNEAYARDERRDEEFAIERELSPVPHHPLLMPWSNDGEHDLRYRRALNTAMFLSLVLAVIIRLVVVPAPVRPVVAQIPERLAMMVRKEQRKLEPVKKAKEEKKEQKKEAKAEGKKEERKETAKAQERPAQERPRAAPAEQTAAPGKAQSAGVLAFKESFKDLIDETPVARLGTEARLNSTAVQTAGQALATRSLVSMQGGGGSGGGGGNAAVSRNAGSGGIGTGAGLGRSAGGGEGNHARLGRGGTGFSQVKSGIAVAEAKESKPVTSSGRPGRTDEEIQILFDRYKAALYRIYNTELRKDPTLRGKMVLRITIEPSGVVSACGVDSSNMNAAEFSVQIVDRVRKFNFGPKDGVPKTTILYPIDFLPSR
ncbi:MAG TPA: AgmX/PglI C-terminal domain-containing protein [Dongiaceae bacterium]|nr:AgmX/PglI C-terminal domain-containing protein [Dongiaceae bacterium]